jgi:hypothetical protein
MNILLWVLQAALALLYLAGGAYKMFSFDELAKQFSAQESAKVAKKATAESVGTRSKGFTDEERAAMKERAEELKAEARASKNKADGDAPCWRRSPRCRNRIAP